MEVYAGKVKIDTGSYAWWVSDESMKAKLNLTRPDRYLDDKAMGDAVSFEGPADTRIPQISNLSFVSELSMHQLNPFLPGYQEEVSDQLLKMTSMDEFAILDDRLGEWAKENKGDYTMTSMGVPVDVTQGRLKEDLTVFIEKGQGLKETDPIIRGGPTDQDYKGPAYPSSLKYEINMPRMGFLKEYATLARQSGNTLDFTFSPSTSKVPSSRAEDDSGEARHGIYPMVTAMAFTFQLTYRGVAASPKENGGKIGIYLVFYPRIMMWNPHNVRLPPTDYVLRIYMPFFLEMGARNERLGKSEKTGDGIDSNIYPALVRYPPEQYDKYKFHPALGYSFDDGSLGLLRKNFYEFLTDKSLRRGKGDHTKGEGAIAGYPVINLKIPRLAFNPGETVELTALEQAKAGNEYVNPPDSSADGVLRAPGRWVELKPGRMVHSSNRIKAETGVIIDTGIRLEAKNFSKLSQWVFEYDMLDGFDAYIPKPDRSDEAEVVAAWRIGPAYDLSDDSPGSNPEKSFPKPGYELWKLNGSDLEYLTSYETGFVNAGGSSVARDVWIGTKNEAAKNKSGPTNYYSGWNQYEYYPALTGARHGVWHFWDNSLSDKNALGNQGDSYFQMYNRKGLTDKESDELFTTQYSVPVIPNVDEFTANDWYVTQPNSDPVLNSGRKNSALVYTVKGNENGYAILGEPSTGPANYTVPNFLDSKYATTPNWSMSTFITVKNNGELDDSTRSRQMPLFMVSNLVRDNGAASRVNAVHGYVSPVGEMHTGHGHPSLKDTLVTDSTWGFSWGRITSQFSESDSSKGSFGYLAAKYSDAGDGYGDRYGSSPLLKHIVRDFQSSGGKGDAGFVLAPFDYPRFEDDLMSLGVFHQANLSTMWWHPTFAFGESYASPFIKRGEIMNTSDALVHENELIDISYMLNASMWDRFYLSTMPQDGSVKPFAGMRLPNTRHVLSSLPKSSGDLHGSEEAFTKSAAHIMVDGPFNVNSTSYEAWRAFLGGMLGVKKKSLAEGDDFPKTVDSSDPESFYMPNPGNMHPLLSPQREEEGYGYRDAVAGRNISEADIDELAREIVAEVKRRAPFFSLADFVNRRLISFAETRDENDSYKGIMGTIAAAIHRVAEDHDSGTPNAFNMYKEKVKLTVTNNPDNGGMYGNPMKEVSREFFEHAISNPQNGMYMSLRGLPGILKQSQILSAIGPFITTRGDTFTVRAFGEYKNPMTGSYSRAYCEAVVQRGAETVDPSDDIVAPNGLFGRRFKVVSFRWLTPKEL